MILRRKKTKLLLGPSRASSGCSNLTQRWTISIMSKIWSLRKILVNQFSKLAREDLATSIMGFVWRFWPAYSWVSIRLSQLSLSRKSKTSALKSLRGKLTILSMANFKMRITKMSKYASSQLMALFTLWTMEMSSLKYNLPTIWSQVRWHIHSTPTVLWSQTLIYRSRATAINRWKFSQTMTLMPKGTNKLKMRLNLRWKEHGSPISVSRLDKSKCIQTNTLAFVTS